MRGKDGTPSAERSPRKKYDNTPFKKSQSGKESKEEVQERTPGTAR